MVPSTPGSLGAGARAPGAAPLRHDRPVTAYWISLYREVRDDEKLAAYAELAGPALTAAGGTFLARGMPEAVYEDAVHGRAVLIEFPSVAAALAAHDGDAYQEALTALGDGAVRDLRIVPAVP